MPARNRKSMEREKARETDSIVDVLAGSRRELRCLLAEMAEILPTPTAIYEQWPRIRVAWELYDQGRREAIYPKVGLNEALPAHRRIRELSDRLDATPWRRQQIRSTEWKLTFLRFHEAVSRQLLWEENTLEPLLHARCDEAGRDRLGLDYRKVLTEPFRAYLEERT